MGRYYNGDIEGKFLVTVQPSNAADRFGVVGETTSLSYNFDGDDLEKVKQELEKIKKTLGENFDKVKNILEHGWNDTIVIENGFSLEKFRVLASEYADYMLGTKIKECLEEQGYCSFEAEL